MLCKGFRLGLDVVVKIQYRCPINFTLLTNKSMCVCVCVCVSEWVREREPVKVRTQPIYYVTLEFFLCDVTVNISNIFSIFLFQFCTAFHSITKVITTQNMHIFT